jgi:hypothetical protein
VGFDARAVTINSTLGRERAPEQRGLNAPRPTGLRRSRAVPRASTCLDYLCACGLAVRGQSFAVTHVCANPAKFIEPVPEVEA